ncbi:MAG: leucyl/phenylalanyl-tRNA--protein transferase [Candidatus Aminicenantes bacterium]|nr:leucyl/phenylalanyl-tRNA--protein transferase [Candidatus Aminicenantes bacterium]
MEIKYLKENTPFPDPSSADKSGLLAVGGSLTNERLIEAYSKGVFPWYSEGDPVLWWSPDPRILLFPDDLHISRKMRGLLKKEAFKVTIDKQFESVIENCSAPRRDGEGTWITSDMKASYIRLHHSGFAHSVEVWKGDDLVGGLYGICFGKMFFGESMFSKTSNSSKFGFIKLSQYLRKKEFLFIDCQIDSQHLRSLGAAPVIRDKFLRILRKGLKNNNISKMVFPDNL